MDFNPFSKPLDQVLVQDLCVLRDVRESWFVDYKREGIKNREIARHLSAFSNQFGGFLFFGIAESQEMTAGDFCGIDNQNVEKLIVDIRDASREHISPHVLFKIFTFKGPCKEINLHDGKTIVMVFVDQSKNPPHIHSSGRIYIRTADQSKELNDRHMLNVLFKRSFHNKKKFSQLITDIPALPKIQKKQPWLFINFVLQQEEYRNKLLTFDEFAECAKYCGLSRSMDMDYISSVPYGYIARHVVCNNPVLATASLRYWHDGSARFIIPINECDIKSFNSKKYKTGNEFVRELLDKKWNESKICDFSYVMTVVEIFIGMYLSMLECTGRKWSLFAHFNMINSAYKVPFFDSQSYLMRCKKYGFPLIQDDNVTSSDEPYYDNMIDLSIVGNEIISRCAEEKDLIAVSKAMAALLAVILFLYVGIYPDKN